MKRILLLLLTNFLIMLLLGTALVVAQVVFGVQFRGWGGYLVIASIFGFGGAFVSLAISKMVAKWTTGAQVITAPANEVERWLVDVVARQAQAAGIKMPEVAIYPGQEVNAFATGPTRNNSLVAVSEGLLNAMSRDEAEAVLAHEVSHVANGDMVTMTLLQGTLNTFVLVAARAVGLVVDKAIFRNEGGPGIGYFVANIAAQLVFGMLASLVTMAFSRHREYRADAGGAQLAGREKMVAALRRLQHNAGGEEELPKSIQAFGISGTFKSLFSSHPPLEERIRALENLPATPASSANWVQG